MSDKGKDSYTREDEDDEDFDDIPDLESVESSEYCDSDEDPDMNPTAIKDLQSANFLIAKNWLNPDGGLDGVFKEFEVLMIYTYTPFLYGEHIEPSYWDNQWFGLFRKANLISQRPFNLDHLFIRDIRVLEILGLTLDWCWAHFGPMQDAVYLGTMLDFWDKIKDNRDFPAVVKYAKGLKWFSEILKHIQAQPDDLGLSNSEFKDAPHTLELCVLYAISHVCYQIVSKTGARHTFRTDLDSRTRIASAAHSGDIQHNLERAEIAFLVLERVEYLDHYRTALRLSPFDKTIYESRLQAHILSAHYLDAASDSMRLLCLQKNHREAHLCLVKSLQELSEETRANIARDKYFSQFPMPSDRQRLERFLNSRDCDITIVKPVHTDTSQSDYKSLRELSKVGTGYYSKGDYDDAHIAFGVCIKNARDKPVWRYSVSWREGLRFLLAVQYCYAQSLFNMGKCLAAIDIFLKLRRYHKMYPFPAAHYWSAMCYINQKRYAEAVQYINTGLKICDSHEARGYSILYWPGTSSTIRECLPQNVKSKLLQIQSQVLKEMEPMATCHYLQCLNYNLKTKIMQEGQEYKGHYVIKCSQKCSIAFHPTCWKKQKNSLCFNSDRAVFSQRCLTPNCNGKVTHIIQYDHTEKIKSEMTLDEMNGDSVKKRKGLDPISLSSSSDSSSSNKNDKTTPAGSENSKTEANSAKPVEQDLNEETRKTPVVEEARNGKDSEEREAKPKSKKKKKNKHQKEEEPQKVNGYELYKSTGDESLKDKEFTAWDSDPAEPFEIPEHFKEQIRQVEGKVVTPSDRPESPPDIDMEVSRIQKNIVSCFEKLFREHGPLNPLDPLLAGAFRNLKGREVLEPIMHRHGGLAEYLLNFPNFKMFENDRGRIVIGLKDKGWNSESMDNDTSTGSAMASGGGPPGIMGTFTSDTGTVDTPAASVDAGTMDATTTVSDMDSSTDVLKSNPGPSDDIVARHFSSGRDPLRKPVLDFPFGPIPHDINATFTNTGGATNTHVSTFTGAVPKTVTDNGVSTVRLLGASTILVTTSAVVGPTDSAAKRKEEEAFRRSSRYKSIESGLSKSDWNKASYGKGMMPEMRSRRIAEAIGGEVKEKISTVPETGGGVVSEMEQKSSNSSNNDEETGPDSSTKGGSASEEKQKASKDSNDGAQTSNKPAPPPPPPPPPPPLPPLKRAPVVPGMMKQKAKKASGSSASGKFIIGGAKALREEPALQNVGVPLGKTPVDENEMETCTRTDTLYRPQYKLREREAKTGGDRDAQKHSIGNGGTDKQKTKGAAKVASVDKGTQCLYIKTSSATQTEREEKTMITVGVNTDPMPVVKTFKENYDELKEVYEKLVKEKESLESKLNVSEDTRVKLQRQHSRELDKNIKKCQSEMRKEMESKLQHSEDLLKLEKEKLQKERRESSEQMKALRADIKQWQDKLNRHKKDVQKKDKEKQDASKILQEEKDELGKRLVSQEEYYQKLLETHVKRAIDSEVRLLNERKEILIKPTEQRLQELDRLCAYASQAMPGGEPELVAYREQLRQSLEMYKNSVDEQISKVIAKEQDLNQLEPVAPPLTHMSPQLKIKTQLVQRSLFASVQRGIVPGLQPPGATGPPQGTAPPPVSMAMPLSAPLDQNMKTGEGGSGGGDNMMTFPSANPETVPQPPPGGFGMNNSGTGMSQGGMGPGVGMSSGMDQTGMGMGPSQMRMGPQTSMGMSQTGMGMNQSSMGMSQTGMGLSQSGMVMNSAGIGVSQSMNQTGMNIEQGGMGMSYNQAGMGSSQGGMGMSVSGQAGLDAGMNFSQATNHDMGMGLGMGLSQVGMGMGLSQGGMGMGLGGMGMSQVGMSMDHSRMGMGAGMGPGGLGPVGTGMGKPNFGMGMRPNLQVSAANQIAAMQPPGGGGGASGQGGGAKPNSERRNFDQLVTKLSPLYPHYSREDFKRAVLELRKKVTLTGLPLDEVIQKVRQVINEREMSKMSAGPAPMATLPQMSLNEGFGFSQQSLMTQGSMFRPMMQQAPQMQSPPLPIHQFQQQKAQQQQAQAQQHQIQAQQQQLQAQQQQLQAQQQQMQQQSQQKQQQQQSQSAEYNDDDNCIICYEDMLPGDSLTLDCRHRFHNHCIRSWLKEQKTCPTCRNYALLKDEFPFLH